MLGACGGPLGRTNDHRVLDASDHTNHNKVIGDCGGSLGHRITTGRLALVADSWIARNTMGCMVPVQDLSAALSATGFLVLVGDLQPPGRNNFML